MSAPQSLDTQLLSDGSPNAFCWTLPPCDEELAGWKQRSFQLMLPTGFSAYSLICLERTPGRVRVSARHTKANGIEVRMHAKYRPGCSSATYQRKIVTSTRVGGSHYAAMIIVPKHEPNCLYFDVEVVFPSLHVVRSFECVMPSFSFTLEETLKSVFFENIDVHTAMPITVKALRARTALLTTKIGLIEGFFNVTNSLELISSCGSINAVIEVKNDLAASVTMFTEIGNIGSTINIDSAAHHLVKLTANVKLGNVHVNLNESNTTHVALIAETLCGDIAVSWPAVCGGNFSVRTSVEQPDVIFPPKSVVSSRPCSRKPDRRAGAFGDGRADIRLLGKRGKAVLTFV
ncbi:hypothetical protein BDZ89DRAFT_1071417 [Hymenopellis radicata]|nr:hypothetical protein BDZ89DRAFT_1071417 [Hymenopellis radicata]